MRFAWLPLLLAAACPAVEGDTGDTGAIDTDTDVVDSDTDLDGAGLFQANCARCHGTDARGTREGPDLSREMRLTDDQIVNVMLNGSGRMPKIPVSEVEARAIVAWLRDTL